MVPYKYTFNKFATLTAMTVLVTMAWPSICRASQLSDILVQVEAHAPALQAAAAEAEAAKAQSLSVKGRYLGQLDIVGQTIHFDDDRLARPLAPPININALPFDDSQYSYGVRGSLPLDINGKITSSLSSARSQAKASSALSENTRLSILASAATLYRSIQDLIGQQDALQKQIDALDAHIRVAEKAIKVGRIADVERLRLVSERESVRSISARLNGTEQGLRARLGALMGEEQFIAKVSPAVNWPLSPVPQTGSLESRPDITAAMARVEQQHALARSAQADRYPSLTVAVEWLDNQGYSSSNVDATWQVALQAQLPVWDGGTRRKAVESARLGKRAAEHQLAALEESATAEVIAAEADWHSAQISHTAARLALQAAEETARIQADRFAAGRLSSADLVDAEAALARSRASVSSAIANWWRADNNWRLALGQTPADYQH